MTGRAYIIGLQSEKSSNNKKIYRDRSILMISRGSECVEELTKRGFV